MRFLSRPASGRNAGRIPSSLYVVMIFDYNTLRNGGVVCPAIHLKDDAAIAMHNVGDSTRVPRLCRGVQVTDAVLCEVAHCVPLLDGIMRAV